MVSNCYDVFKLCSGHSAFPSRYVWSLIRMGAAMRYNPYGGGPSNLGPPQKGFKYTYTFEPPSQLAIEVIHQGEKPVIYMQKYNYFMSLSMEEMYDLLYNMKHILDRMELCKGILMGTREFQPRSKKDLMMVAKHLSRAKQLEREDQMAMYYVPPLKARRRQAIKIKATHIRSRMRKMQKKRRERMKKRRKKKRKRWKEKKKIKSLRRKRKLWFLLLLCNHLTTGNFSVGKNMLEGKPVLSIFH